MTTFTERELPRALSARSLILEGARGRVYGPVDLDVPSGWLVALVGHQGSGRTSLLLTLTGRMVPTSGWLSVLGRDPAHRRFLQAHCALAGFASIDSLDESLRVGEVIAERAGLVVPLWRRPQRFGDPAMQELIACVFGDHVLDPDVQLWELSALRLAQLHVLLALIGAPRVMAVDDVDAVRDPREQGELWRTLQRVCGRGVTVVAAATSSRFIPGDIRVVELDSEEN